MDGKSIANEIERLCVKDPNFRRWANSSPSFYKFWHFCRYETFDEKALIFFVKALADHQTATEKQLLDFMMTNPIPSFVRDGQ